MVRDSARHAKAQTQAPRSASSGVGDLQVVTQEIVSRMSAAEALKVTA